MRARGVTAHDLRMDEKYFVVVESCARMLTMSIGTCIIYKIEPESLVSGTRALIRICGLPSFLLFRFYDIAAGDCSSKARATLLRVVAALGGHVPEAGVTSQLLVILSDGVATKDIHCEPR